MLVFSYPLRIALGAAKDEQKITNQKIQNDNIIYIINAEPWELEWSLERGRQILREVCFIHVKGWKGEGAEIRKLKRTCSGMCGYDWMVESILACGEIRQTIRDKIGKVIQSPYMEKKEEVMA